MGYLNKLLSKNPLIIDGNTIRPHHKYTDDLYTGSENVMTDNESIKALEEYLQKCQNIKYGARKKILVDADFLKDVLNQINRLKAKNKEFDEKIVIQMGTIDWQAKEINRQKAEIERLTTELVGMRGAANSYKMYYEKRKAEVTLLNLKIKEQKSEAIKEFAERLCKDRVSNDPVVIAVKVELEMMKEQGVK